MYRKIHFGLIFALLMVLLTAGCAGFAGQSSPTPPGGSGAYPASEETVVLVTLEATEAVSPYPGAEAAQPSVGKDEILVMIEALQAVGAQVELDGTITQEFFSPLGLIARVNGEDVQVFKYPDAASAQREAESVAPDGSKVGNVSVAWVAAPHFYRFGNLIVLYVGNDEAILQALEKALGAPFAGQ